MGLKSGDRVFCFEYKRGELVRKKGKASKNKKCYTCMNQIGFDPKLADYFQTLIGLKSYMGTIQAMNLALP